MRQQISVGMDADLDEGEAIFLDQRRAPIGRFIVPQTKPTPETRYVVLSMFDYVKLLPRASA